MIPDINLLPKYERHQSLAPIIFYFGVFICLLLFSAFIIFYIQFKSELQDVKLREEDYRLEIERLEQQIATKQMSENESFENAIKFATTLKWPTSFVLDEFIKQLGNNGFLKFYKNQEGTVNLQTNHFKKSEIALFTNNLVESDYLRNVQLESIDTIERTEEDEKNRYYQAEFLIELDVEQLNEEVQLDDPFISRK